MKSAALRMAVMVPMAPPSNPACSQCDAEFMQDLQAHTAPPTAGEHKWCVGCVCLPSC